MFSALCNYVISGWQDVTISNIQDPVVRQELMGQLNTDVDTFQPPTERDTLGSGTDSDDSDNKGSGAAATAVAGHDGTHVEEEEEHDDDGNVNRQPQIDIDSILQQPCCEYNCLHQFGKEKLASYIRQPQYI